ncbi:hypothetical protein KM043_011015 [Ampulex compressa]|nr:hypothetical protein KM043_011015 [Ampulex compressa]
MLTRISSLKAQTPPSSSPPEVPAGSPPSRSTCRYSGERLVLSASAQPAQVDVYTPAQTSLTTKQAVLFLARSPGHSCTGCAKETEKCAPRGIWPILVAEIFIGRLATRPNGADRQGASSVNPLFLKYALHAASSSKVKLYLLCRLFDLDRAERKKRGERVYLTEPLFGGALSGSYHGEARMLSYCGV